MVLAALAGCGEPPARVRLAPLGGECARPVDARLVQVTAYAVTGEHTEVVAIDETAELASFPADTEQIGVEVIVGGGAVGAAGKSAPLVFNALADGATIPVFMGPPGGLCAVGAMTDARAQPLVARAGDGVLVVGGTGPGGPLSTAEYYNPATATFSPVTVPADLVDPQGFTGAALATLADGRVAVIGGPTNAFAVFDAAVRAFTVDRKLSATDSRAFHAAIAVGDDVVVAGGCSEVLAGACGGVPRNQIVRIHPSQPGDPDRSLPTTGDMRVGAQLFDLGVQPGGLHEYLLAGGSRQVDIADRFALDDVATTMLTGGHAQPVALDGGAVLAAFADDGPATAASGVAAIYPPGSGPAHRIADAPALKSVRLVALEDGRVAGFGGDPMGRVLTYDPMRDSWDLDVPASQDQTGPLVAPALARLADGTVLVVGGSLSTQAWVYRPSLVGPASGSVTAVPASPNGRDVLIAADPATVTRTASPRGWQMTAPDGALSARALVGGPRNATGSVSAVVHVGQGGVALIAQQTAPGQAIVAELVPAQRPRIVRLDGGVERPVCSPPPALGPFDPATAVTLRLAIGERDARLSIDGREVAACDLAATDRGSWGVAPLGAGAQLVVDSVTVTR
jgi:hypothetical protein